MRGADAIYISNERLAEVKSESYLDVAPELVVEVLSPGECWSDINDKLEEYFDIGVKMVWIADPKRKQVFVYHSLTEIERFTADERISCKDILPGFEVSTAELF